MRKTWPALEVNREKSSTNVRIMNKCASRSLILDFMIMYIKMLRYSSIVKLSLESSTSRPDQNYLTDSSINHEQCFNTFILLNGDISNVNDLKHSTHSA